MSNLAELGRRWARIRPDHVAVRCDGEDLTYRELDDSSDALARGLVASGVGHGDRVGILLHNCPEITELVVATLKLGAICVPLNVMLTNAELAPIVLDSGCSVVVTEESLLPSLELACSQRPELRIYATTSLEGTEQLDSLRLDGAQIAIAEAEADTPAFICYTSGTTGVQKGAVLTHGSIPPGAIAKIICEGLTYNERVLVPVALVYTGAMISCFMQISFFLGATMVLERSADPEHLLDVVERERITAMTSVPVVYERMAASASFAGRDISSLRSVTAGGAPVSLGLLQAFQAKGVPMIQSYGMTECSGLASILDFCDAVDHLGFAGLPILGCAVAILDADGKVLGPGEVGEVCIRGPHVMLGYWGKPDMTAETIVGGWLHSGDLGLTDNDGFVKIVDRRKDMLISGGHNVYPAEIERALGGLSSVDELTVIGVPDDRWGEVPMLVFRTTRDDNDVADEIRRVCEVELAKYKRPKYLVNLGEPLPRTFSGKVSKPALRKRFASAPESAIRY